MTDKDLTEPGALRESFQSVQLLICMFHTLKAFKAWLDKSKLCEQQKEFIRTMIEKLAYSSSEQEYAKLYNNLLAGTPFQLIDYHNAN